MYDVTNYNVYANVNSINSVKILLKRLNIRANICEYFIFIKN